MLEIYIDSCMSRSALIIAGLFALTYPQWLPLIRRNEAKQEQIAKKQRGVESGEFDSLITRLEALGDQLAAEAKTGQPPSIELGRAVIQTMRDLQALKIRHPNWHGLSIWPILAWLPYVDSLLPALRRRNIREARDVINHVDMADGLKP